MTNAEAICRMTILEMTDFIERVEDGEIDYAKTFCSLCEGNCDKPACIEWWLRLDADNFADRRSVHDGL